MMAPRLFETRRKHSCRTLAADANDLLLSMGTNLRVCEAGAEWACEADPQLTIKVLKAAQVRRRRGEGLLSPSSSRFRHGRNVQMTSIVLPARLPANLFYP